MSHRTLTKGTFDDARTKPDRWFNGRNLVIAIVGVAAFMLTLGQHNII
jgi:hypothetical protein